MRRRDDFSGDVLPVALLLLALSLIVFAVLITGYLRDDG